MNKKRAGAVFMAQMIALWVTIIVLGMLSRYININIIQNAFLSEGILVVPAIGILVMYERKPMVLLSVNKLRVDTFFKVILFTILTWPAIMAANVLSQIFTVNAVDTMSDSILEMPFVVMLIIIGIVGPICEEFVFRGVIYGALRRTGKIRTAIVVQAIAFGLMHGNLNQFCYALVIGILMGYLLEASGTIFSTMWMHILINSTNVFMVYWAASRVDTSQTEAARNSLDEMITPGFMFCVYVILIFFAVGGLILANLLLKNIAKSNGRQGWLARMKSLPVYDSVMSWQMSIGMLLAVVMIALELFIEHMS